MNAEPLLARVARELRRVKLEAVLIGNAAALHGAPVTTLDFDFMFRETRPNIRKLESLAKGLRADLSRPYYPMSRLYRVLDEASDLQLDFMPSISGVRSFEGLRARSTVVEFADTPLRVASLADIIKSKRAANRPADRAVLPILEATLEEQEAEES